MASTLQVQSSPFRESPRPDALRDLAAGSPKASTPRANRSPTLQPIKQLDDGSYRIWRLPVSDAC
jgi:hypothetical protein